MKKGIRLKYKKIAVVCVLFTRGLKELAVEGKSVNLWPINHII